MRGMQSPGVYWVRDHLHLQPGPYGRARCGAGRCAFQWRIGAPGLASKLSAVLSTMLDEWVAASIATSIATSVASAVPKGLSAWYARA